MPHAIITALKMLEDQIQEIDTTEQEQGHPPECALEPGHLPECEQGAHFGHELEKVKVVSTEPTTNLNPQVSLLIDADLC